jgi:hypothetical protein
MPHASILAVLQGGDRRSIGKSNQLARQILDQPDRFAELFECLWSDDPVVRMRAADAAEKISLQRPALLRPFKAELLGLADETTQPEMRWHLALMLPRLPLTQSERERAIARLHCYLADRSSIVKTCAIQGLSELARGNATLEAAMVELLRAFSRAGTPAMKARSRNLLMQFDSIAIRRKGAAPVLNEVGRKPRKPNRVK